MIEKSLQTILNQDILIIFFILKSDDGNLKKIFYFLLYETTNETIVTINNYKYYEISFCYKKINL